MFFPFLSFVIFHLQWFLLKQCMGGCGRYSRSRGGDGLWHLPLSFLPVPCDLCLGLLFQLSLHLALGSGVSLGCRASTEHLLASYPQPKASDDPPKGYHGSRQSIEGPSFTLALPEREACGLSSVSWEWGIGRSRLILEDGVWTVCYVFLLPWQNTRQKQLRKVKFQFYSWFEGQMS